MNRWKKLPKLDGNRGQSLVETALFLPILIFMLAGIVEVSNLLITQNRVTTSSRMGAGFGAANFDRENWANDADGTAYDMGIVALNTITESMPLSPDQWDIYSAHGLTTQDGTGFEVFESEWVYGNHIVVSAAEWSAMESQIQADILDALQAECAADPASCAGNVEFVVSVPFHNLDTILGLPVWQWVGFQRVRGLTVMRVRPIIEAKGCPILPIVVRMNQYSIYPSNWPEGEYLVYDDDPVALFPEGSKSFDIPKKDVDNNNMEPDPHPTYTNLGSGTNLVPDNFERNIPGIPLWQAISESDVYAGNVYWARDLGATGNFGWLTWDGAGDEPTLVESLIPGPPGDFVDVYPGSTVDQDDPENKLKKDFVLGDKDGDLEKGEWLEGATGNMAQQTIRALYYPYVKDQWEVGIVVFQNADDDSGTNLVYQAEAFITVKILGMSFSGSDKWILFEFVSAGRRCSTVTTS